MESMNSICTDMIDEGKTKTTCDICGNKLGSKLSLFKHRVLFHSDSDTIFCNVCGRLSSAVEDRDAHRTECALKRRKSKLKKFKHDVRCELCNKSFKTTYTSIENITSMYRETCWKDGLRPLWKEFRSEAITYTSEAYFNANCLWNLQKTIR